MFPGISLPYTHIGRLENKTNNTVAWSPKGRFLVLATVGSSSKSDIEFWDLDFSVDDTKKENADPGASLQLMATGDHYGVTELAWDPSGRYVASSASAWRTSVSTMAWGWGRPVKAFRY